MTKLNKTPKQKSVEPLSPPTHEKFVIEVNHNCSFEISREQSQAFTDRDLATCRKDRLVKNYDGVGYHRLCVIRITNYLYNKCTMYKTATGVLIKKLREFLEPIIEWRYRSCIAILMGRL